MALTSTLYRFAIELSDVDRAVYVSLDLRVPMHPSERPRRMLARVLALLLHHAPGIEMGRGLSNVDEPAVWVRDLQGRVEHWIDVGTPAPPRLHRASKHADRVSVMLYEPSPHWVESMRRADVHRKDELDVHLLPAPMLDALEASLDRKVAWNVTRSDGVLYVEADGQSQEGRLGAPRNAVPAALRAQAAAPLLVGRQDRPDQGPLRGCGIGKACSRKRRRKLAQEVTS